MLKTLIFIVIGALVFFTTSIGYIVFNLLLLGTIEVFAMLFSGLIGFVILGLIISWVLTKFNNHI